MCNAFYVVSSLLTNSFSISYILLYNIDFNINLPFFGATHAYTNKLVYTLIYSSTAILNIVIYFGIVANI